MFRYAFARHLRGAILLGVALALALCGLFAAWPWLQEHPIPWWKAPELAIEDGETPVTGATALLNGFAADPVKGGVLFIGLVSGLFAAHLGGCILQNERNRKTMELVSALPMSRVGMDIQFFLAGLLLVLLQSLIAGAALLGGIAMTEKGVSPDRLWLAITPALSSMAFFSVCFGLTSVAGGTAIGRLTFLIVFFAELAVRGLGVRNFCVFLPENVEEMCKTGRMGPGALLACLIPVGFYCIVSVIASQRRNRV